MDSQLGRVLDHVKNDATLVNNTIIVFTSDHGYHLSERMLPVIVPVIPCLCLSFFPLFFGPMDSLIPSVLLSTPLI
jgi:arylsulfatase A-like enzyme